MGIRIRKMMGYGLTDVEPEDPRINWGSPVFEHELGDAGEYAAWLAKDKENRTDVVRHLYNRDGNDPRDYRPQECFAWGTEDGGLENVICVRPLAWRDWYRYDDAIDYVESPNSEALVVPLRHGIFPHNVNYMDKRVGEVITMKEGDPHMWHRIRHSLEDSGQMEAQGSKAALDTYASCAGPFKDHADALIHCKPHVPEEVRNLVEWAGLLNDPADVLHFEPMVYTWWA